MTGTGLCPAFVSKERYQSQFSSSLVPSATRLGPSRSTPKFVLKPTHLEQSASEARRRSKQRSGAVQPNEWCHPSTCSGRPVDGLLWRGRVPASQFRSCEDEVNRSRLEWSWSQAKVPSALTHSAQRHLFTLAWRRSVPQATEPLERIDSSQCCHLVTDRPTTQCWASLWQAPGVSLQLLAHHRRSIS